MNREVFKYLLCVTNYVALMCYGDSIWNKEDRHELPNVIRLLGCLFLLASSLWLTVIIWYDEQICYDKSFYAKMSILKLLSTISVLLMTTDLYMSDEIGEVSWKTFGAILQILFYGLLFTYHERPVKNGLY